MRRTIQSICQTAALLLAGSLVGELPSFAADHLPPEQREFFEKEVRPLLVKALL